MHLLAVALAVGAACPPANAAVSVLGVQYQQDEPFTEYLCLWHDRNYPASCGVDLPGANLHVFLKNEGTSAVTLDDVSLEGYSLKTILKQKDNNGHLCNSIYYYWDNPPAAIFSAGEPAWYKMDPRSIPPGGVGQVIVRLRYVPTTTPLDVNVDTSADILPTSITVDENAPQLANISFSQDLRKVYLYWRRAGGAAPATIRMDGADVTARCVTVNDADCNFAVTVYTGAAPLTEMSYHVFQGVYSDGKRATGGVRAWKNPFIYDSWAAFPLTENNDAIAMAWIDTCEDRGINTLEMNGDSGFMDFYGRNVGKQYAEAHNYGIIKDDNSWGTYGDNPRLWFIDDEPDAEEANVVNNFCEQPGQSFKLPCNSNQAGMMGMHFISVGESLRNIKNRPTTINMNGTWKPYSWYAYGQLSDCLCIDSYYQKRVMDSYYFYPNTQPLYEKATVIHATSLAGTRAAEPNPFRILLYSCQATPDGFPKWPWADPQTKRTEVYYALAGGAKGIGYWWFKKAPSASNGLGDHDLVPQDAPLWKEIGLCGAEIKTLQPYLVTSHPVDLEVAGSTNVWVKGLAWGTETLILFAVNDNHWNDQDWHGTDTLNATVMVTLPAWMQSPAPTAFEFSRSGLRNVSTQLNGSQLQLSIGTLSVARMFIVTTDPLLRMEIQQRYDTKAWPGICRFAPDVGYQITDPPSIVRHPLSRSAFEGESVVFGVTAAGGSPFGFQWQKNGSNLTDGGHYSGCTTFALTVSSADAGDEAGYRCVVTNPYGSAATNAAVLTLSTVDITQQPTPQSLCPGSTARFTVAATGQGTLSYQWQKDQADLSDGGHYSGCNTPALTISAADAGDEGNYRCAVTDDTGTAYSNEASLTLGGAPTITQQPFDQLAEPGGTVEFTVTASGSGLAYLWQKNRSNLSDGGHYSGCTTPTLTVSSIDSTDEGAYRCVVTSECGNTASDEAMLAINPCGTTFSLQNGFFDDGTGGWSVAPGWTSYASGDAYFYQNTSLFLSSPNAQRVRPPSSGAAAYAGVYQNVAANQGDALTIMVQAYNESPSSYITSSLGVQFDGSTTPPSSWQTNVAKQAWTTLTVSGNPATAGNGVTVFLHTVRGTSGQYYADFDNVEAYCAYVPPAPAVTGAGAAALNVNVAPGCNLPNPDAQYAITIGGGGYSLGTHWVQADGTIGTVAFWQTDAAWSTQTVTGLTTGTVYTFRVKARHSTTYTWESILGTAASGTPEGGCIPPGPPTNAQANPPAIDPGGTAQLSADPGNGGDTVEWFTGGCGGAPVPGGASPTVSPEATTTYYARTKDSASDCVSETCAVVTVTVNVLFAAPDFDNDGDVDQEDFGRLQACLKDPLDELTELQCQSVDLDGDSHVDQRDFSIFQACLSGADVPADPSCTD